MTTIKGTAHWELTDPSGTLIASGTSHNIVTAYGEQVYAEQGSGAASPAPAPLGMKLGTGNTSPSRTGAGSTLATYLSNSQQAFDSGFPAVTTPAGRARVTYQVTYGPGKATTTSPITEAVIVNANLTNVNSAASNVTARVLLEGIAGKASDHTLTITWSHDIIGG